MYYNNIISVHCLVCAHACLCVGVCVCSFTFGLHWHWLDCSHPPIHPIATIATDGAAGINAPGSASLINGRLIKRVISDLFLSWPLSPPIFSIVQLPPIMGAHLMLYLLFQLCWTPLYPCCQCMSSVVVESSLVSFYLLFHAIFCLVMFYLISVSGNL